MKTPGPDHPIDIQPNPHRMRASFGKHVIADSVRTVTLSEGGYKPVPYFPLDDVDAAFLSKTEHTTHCPYKGDAGYYSIYMDGTLAENAVWTYAEPYPAVEAIRGYVAFYPDKFDVYELDENDPRSQGIVEGVVDGAPGQGPTRDGAPKDV